ncbi:MAG: hypothetical protein EXS68_00015 [Candidatus Ryanbacteria bacterium]|nr:hypothetical protein [Candidatus Ryanbacteria bacterium]
MSIETLLQKKSEDAVKPQIFDLSIDADRVAVEDLLKSGKTKQASDSFEVRTTHNKKDLRPHIALRSYQDEKYFKLGTKPKYIAADSQAKVPVLVK